MSVKRAPLQLALPLGQSISALTPIQADRLFRRGRAMAPQVVQDVAGIIASVRSHGDAALRELSLRYDGVSMNALEVPRVHWERALEELDPAVRSALDDAAHAIATFHRAQLPVPFEMEVRRGVKLGRRTEPLRSVGVYAPGGRAAYPSSVLMGVVPARIAAVHSVIVASPPGPTGRPHPGVMAACALAGADRLFALGGAGAVAALALGTSSVPRVDKLVGPGNAYVTEAKRQLNGYVAIDGLAGPSEILVLADDAADPELIALELLAQAEHDPDAASVLVCSSMRVIEAAAQALERRLTDAPRHEIAAAALSRNGALLHAADEAESLNFAEQYAPEHMVLLTRHPRQTLEGVRAAGSVFLGAGSSVVFGDYSSGANHVLPTGGLARAYAGLGVADFQRSYTFQEICGSAAAALAEPTGILADAEGLPAHARAARQRANMRGAAAPAVLRRAYDHVALYDPQRAPCEVDLSDNTNLFGMPPATARALANLPTERLTRAPAVFAHQLKEELARWFGVKPQNVVTGCGSDDVIDSALRAFCEPGERVVFPEPTFGMVATFARMNAALPMAVPLTSQLELAVPELIECRGRVTYICRPNNPTGTVFREEDIGQVAEQVPGILLVDEAYADFADEADFTQYAAASERVVSLRTFSKAFGLAGLRIGFAIGPEVLVHEIEKSRGPYKVSNVAEMAAVAALQEDADWIRSRVAQVRHNRERLRTALLERGVQCFTSGGNFLLLAVPAPHTAATLAAGLRKRGVAVRPFSALAHLGDCVRVTIGPWPLMERFLEGLAAS